MKSSLNTKADELLKIPQQQHVLLEQNQKKRSNLLLNSNIKKNTDQEKQTMFRSTSHIVLPSLTHKQNIEQILNFNHEQILSNHKQIYQESINEMDRIISNNTVKVLKRQKSTIKPVKPVEINIKNYIKENKQKIFISKSPNLDDFNNSFYVFSNNGDDNQDEVYRKDSRNHQKIKQSFATASKDNSAKNTNLLAKDDFQSYLSKEDTTQISPSKLTTINQDDTAPDIQIIQSQYFSNETNPMKTPIFDFKIEAAPSSFSSIGQYKNLDQEKKFKEEIQNSKINGSNPDQRVITPGWEEENKLQDINAVKQFFDRFKRADKNKDQKVTAFSKFIDKCDEFHIPPRPFGIVQRKRKREDININEQSIGDNYAQALAEGLQLFKDQKSLVLNQNNITDIGIESIAKSLKNNLIILNISHNPKITLSGLHTLFEIIDQKLNSLQQLVLEGNQIGDKALASLCDILISNNSITFLNLSQNKITCDGAKYLAEVVRLNNRINVLFIRWNQIKSRGASYLAKSLQTNDGLQIFDASFNSFGSQGLLANEKSNTLNVKDQTQISLKSQSKLTKNASSFVNIGLELQQMFRENKTLIHIDLSHNNLRRADCDLIEKGLKDNHTILGLHMIGNDVDTNSQGFFSKKPSEPSVSHITSRIQPSLETGSISKRKVDLQATSNCWICEGWTQVQFRWNPADVVLENGQAAADEVDDNTLVFIHLSCDDENEPDLMEKDEFTGDYVLMRMVPPGKINYYYSIAQQPDALESNKDFSLSMLNKKIINVPSTDIMQNVIQTKQIITKFYLEDMTVMPRPLSKKVKGLKREKTAWDFKKSIFRDYMPDNEALLTKCFEYDWSNSKIPKIIKDEKELLQVKSYLRTVYKYLRETYKYFAGINPNNGVPSIGQNVFQEISNHCNLVNEQMKLSDLDLEFISTNAGNKSQTLNPDRSLVRYQIMEILVRIAIFKYFKSKVVNTIFDAVTMIFNESLLPFIKKFNSHEWRVSRLWNEECDQVYKYYLPVLKAVYEKYSGKYAKPGQPKFMSLEEINDFAVTAAILDDQFGQRELGIQFNLAMMTQVAELENDRHIKMSMVEFIDAFGRIADKFNVALIQEEDNYDEFQAFKDERQRERIKSDKKLAFNLEWLFKRCIQYNLGEGFLKEFKRMQKSPKKKRKESAYPLGQYFGMFPVSYQQNIFKQSSTAILASTFILFVGYTVVKIISNIKNKFGENKEASTPQIFKNFTKVVEYDLAPSLMVYFFMIGLGEFFIFAAVFGYFMLITGALLVLAYQKSAFKLILILRIFLVIFTIGAFFNIFIDNMIFKDNYPELLQGMANGGNIKPEDLINIGNNEGDDDGN